LSRLRWPEKVQAQQAKIDADDGPKWWSPPASKQAWQENHACLEARWRSLSVRLDSVRGIENDMGVYRPKIEELATRKMRREHPALAAAWDASQEQGRRAQLEKQRDGKVHHRSKMRV
jgi:hypothetical protein